MRGGAAPEGPAARRGSVPTVSGLVSRNLVAQNHTVYRSEVLVGSAGFLARVSRGQNQDVGQAGSYPEAQGKNPLPSSFRLWQNRNPYGHRSEGAVASLAACWDLPSAPRGCLRSFSSGQPWHVHPPILTFLRLPLWLFCHSPESILCCFKGSRDYVGPTWIISRS